MKRREFLLGTLAGAGALTTPFSMATNFSLAQTMLSQSSLALPGHKALVCVFLYGGHDSLNLLLPTDNASYQSYLNTRQNLAYAQNDIVPLSVSNSTNYDLGLPAFASSLLELFNTGKLSFASNVGPMQAPATKQTLLENESSRPPQLFSHNDQQALWQAGNLQTDSSTGWAGRMADLVMDTNNPLSMNISVDGTNLWQAGNAAQSYSVDTRGPEEFAALDPSQRWNQERHDVFSRLRNLSSHPLEVEYNNRISRAELNNATIIEALNSITPSQVVYPPNSSLAEQLRMTADLIQSQSMLGHSRQIFYVGLGGFDTHDNQLDRLPQLVTALGDAMLAFQNDLTARGLSQHVLTFTQSDFGRTLTSNGDGTDHGWGAHQLIMGDMVTPNSVIGSLPSFELDSNDDIGDGRIIPTMSIEQYAAPMARWFGINDSAIADVFPLANRFDLNMYNL